MTIPFILPTKSLQRFFCSSLEEDTTLDLDAIEKTLPAIYWQLPTKRPKQPHNLTNSSIEIERRCVLQQRLWLQESLFSEAIIVLTENAIELLYLQLLPPLQPTKASLNHRYANNFLKKYNLCIRRSIKNLTGLALVTAKSNIHTTILNPRLAESFKCSGYLQNSSKEKHSGINLPMEQFSLTYQLQPPVQWVENIHP